MYCILIHLINKNVQNFVININDTNVHLLQNVVDWMYLDIIETMQIYTADENLLRNREPGPLHMSKLIKHTTQNNANQPVNYWRWCETHRNASKKRKCILCVTKSKICFVYFNINICHAVFALFYCISTVKFIKMDWNWLKDTC